MLAEKESSIITITMSFLFSWGGLVEKSMVHFKVVRV